MTTNQKEEGTIIQPAAMVTSIGGADGLQMQMVNIDMLMMVLEVIERRLALPAHTIITVM